MESEEKQQSKWKEWSKRVIRLLLFLLADVVVFLFFTVLVELPCGRTPSDSKGW